MLFVYAVDILLNLHSKPNKTKISPKQIFTVNAIFKQRCNRIHEKSIAGEFRKENTEF